MIHYNLFGAMLFENAAIALIHANVDGDEMVQTKLQMSYWGDEPPHSFAVVALEKIGLNI